MSSGVPQGSILGSLIFGIHKNNLSSIPQKCITQSYVDDTKLITSFQLKDNLNATTDWNGIHVKHVFQTTDIILNAIDKKKLTAVVLLDMSKAFDTVNHKTPSLKLPVSSGVP